VDFWDRDFQLDDHRVQWDRYLAAENLSDVGTYNDREYLSNLFEVSRDNAVITEVLRVNRSRVVRNGAPAVDVLVPVDFDCDGIR